MDDQIAPVDDSSGGDPIAAYRKYLEANTGYRAGAGPSLDTPPPAAPAGAAPSIAPVNPNAAPQGAQIAPSGGMPMAPPGAGGSMTPTLDMAMPNPLAPDASMAPQADQADQAPQAPKAKKAAKMKGARQAQQAPMIAPVQGQGPPPDEQQDAGPGAAPGPAAGPAAAGGISSDPSQMTPASGHVIPGQKTQDGRPVIGIHPPDHDPDTDFDKDKLKDVHNAADLLDALKPAARTKYMDWWEQQHGDINDRYDAMLQDLGQRPDPNRQPTRQEKFAELMNFGLNLMRNAKRGTDQVAGAAEAAQDALATQQAKQRQQTSDYDTRAANINAQRQNQLKDLGNYGSAVREDAMIQNDNTRTAIAALNATKAPKTGQPQTRYDAKGNMYTWRASPDDPSKMDWYDQAGNTLAAGTKMTVTGPRGGTGGGGSKQLQLIQALESRGYSTADAVNNVLHVKPSGDPFHDYVSVLNKNTPAGATPEEKADAASMAQETVDHMYGPGALDAARAKRNSVINGPGATPPISTLQQGKVTKFKNGQRWTLGPNGQPQQVQ